MFLDDFEVDGVFDEETYATTSISFALRMNECKTRDGKKVGMRYIPGFL